MGRDLSLVGEEYACVYSHHLNTVKYIRNPSYLRYSVHA